MSKWINIEKITSDQAYLLAEEIPSDGGSGTEDGEDDENINKRH